MEEHPEVPFHEVIDIIRDDADKEYLDQIARHNHTPSEQSEAAYDASNPAPKTLIYLDRNNTPDVWGDIRDTVNQSSESRDFRTVVLLPKQEAFDKTLYHQKNPICPHLIFECCNRIFKRKEHGCLSGANKPKAVEVVLKFAKLHDQFDFHDDEQIRSYFDEVLFLDFMKYASRKEPLRPDTIQGLIDAYNATPENFGVPSDDVIRNVINLVDEQMEIDARIEGPPAVPYNDDSSCGTEQFSDSPTGTTKVIIDDTEEQKPKKLSGSDEISDEL